MKRRLLTAILILAMMITAIPLTTLEVEASSNVKIGDYIEFGSYYDEPILWRVIDLDDQGDPLLYAEHIISLKAFDAAGDYHTDSQRREYGSNEWEPSNIRQWLNSSDQRIDWLQNPPTAENLWYGHNPYADEKGFLADGNFTEEERMAIKPVTHKVLLADIDQDKRDGGRESHQPDYSILNVVANYNAAYYKMLEDKVFFLSVKEIKELVHDRGWQYRRKPTEKAVENSNYERDYIESGGYWVNWFRSPSASYSDYVRVVSGDGYVGSSDALRGYGGVVPALSLNLSSVIFKSGSGTESNPYEVTGKSSEGHIYLILAVVIIGTAALFILLKSKKSKVSIENEDEKNKLNVKFCSKCGKDLNIRAKFCEKCGHQLDDNNL